MVETYIAKTLHGEIVAFSRGAYDVKIYCPDGRLRLQEKINVTDVEWQEQKKSYAGRSDVNQYNDTVNAAWHALALNTFNRDHVKLLKNKTGTYYPRIWRGIFDLRQAYCYNNIKPGIIYSTAYIGSNVAISSIFDAMEALFSYIEPDETNFSVFGHKLREILILASMEVESAWRSVLEANSYESKPRYTTNDYFYLAEPLNLKEWSVSLRNYPNLGSFSPFALWERSNPTQSIHWYFEYNAVKHHREVNFKSANLHSLINAVAALHIMQAAQFGPEIYDRFMGNERSPFITIRHPTYDISDLYVDDFINGGEIEPIGYFL